MEFSYATTTSEADWERWATRNVEVADGGISVTRTSTFRQSTVDDAVVDVAAGPNGPFYLLTERGSLYRPDPETGALSLFEDGIANWLSSPCAIAASATHVYIADGSGETVITASVDGETGSIQTDRSDPDVLAHWRGGLLLFEDGDATAVGGSSSPPDWSPAAPIDAASTETTLCVLDLVDGDPVVRTHGTDPRQQGEDRLCPRDSFSADGRPFAPTAIALAGDAVFLAGTFEESEQAGVFEWAPVPAEWRQVTAFEEPCHALAGRSNADGSRTLHAVVGEQRRCLELREVDARRRRPDRDDHAGLAVTRYDAGESGIEWHRITLGLARSSVDTQVRVWYSAADDPGATPLGAPTEPDGGLAAETATAQAEAEAETLTPAARASLDSLGVTSLVELVTADAAELAGRDDAVTTDEITAWQQTAFDALEREMESDWSLVEAPDSHDLLLEDAVGRYLSVAIELVGTPTASPLVDSVTAYCPRQSYLRHMPELYQEDEASAAFLDRFLSVFETSFVDVQAELDGMTRFLDPAGVPSDSLAWLEDWLAADQYREWPESARREYLARAPELYEMRGTRAGLRETIELYLRHATDASIGPIGDETRGGTPQRSDTGAAGDVSTGHRLFIIEPADIDRIDGVADGHAYESLLAHDRSFVVCCGPFESNEHRAAIETIVRTEKPAHVEATLLSLEAEFALGPSTLLGLNSRLGTESFSLGSAPLGEDTYLDDAG